MTTSVMSSMVGIGFMMTTVMTSVMTAVMTVFVMFYKQRCCSVHWA